MPTSSRHTMIHDRVSISAPPLPPNASVCKRWKFRRNLVIFVAHRDGISQRLLADVFDLPRSRIAAIIKEVEHYHSIINIMNN
jgi:hypothetical protein